MPMFNLPPEIEARLLKVHERLFPDNISQEEATTTAMERIANAIDAIDDIPLINQVLQMIVNSDEHLKEAARNVEKLPEDKQFTTLLFIVLIHMGVELAPESDLAKLLQSFTEKQLLEVKATTQEVSPEKLTAIKMYRINNNWVDFLIESTVDAKYVNAFIRRNQETPLEVLIEQKDPENMRSFVVHVPTMYFTNIESMELTIAYQSTTETGTKPTQDKHEVLSGILEKIKADLRTE